MITNIETWQDVLNFLKTLTAEQLRQPAELLPPSPFSDEPYPLQHVIYGGTVADAEVTVQCGDDSQHHPERVILAYDECPYDADGSIAVDLLTGERIFPPKA